MTLDLGAYVDSSLILVPTTRIIGSVLRLRGGATRRTRSVFGNDPAGPAVHPAAIVVVVVGLGHLTHRMHIFHESHVPSQQT